MIGEFLLGLLEFDANKDVIYSRKIKYSQFKKGDKPHTFRHNNAYDTPEYFRICDRAYKVSLVKELLTTQDPDVIDYGYSTAVGRAKRDKDVYDLVAAGNHAQWVAAKYNNVPVQAIEAAIARHTAWLAPFKNTAEEQKRKAEEVPDPQLVPTERMVYQNEEQELFYMTDDGEYVSCDYYYVTDDGGLAKYSGDA